MKQKAKLFSSNEEMREKKSQNSIPCLLYYILQYPSAINFIFALSSIRKRNTAS